MVFETMIHEKRIRGRWGEMVFETMIHEKDPSCKLCDFKTEQVHLMEEHLRTAHGLKEKLDTIVDNMTRDFESRVNRYAEANRILNEGPHDGYLYEWSYFDSIPMETQEKTYSGPPDYTMG